ncbi:MAG: M67 family peptidase, partial [Anaerolineales bacterium]
LENNFEADQRRRRYQIDARAMMQVEIAADDRQLEIVGIFHSHPDHPARPSDYDLEHSLPWFAYIITSIEAGSAGSSRAWRLLDDRSQFEEIQIDVEKSEGEDGHD